MTHQGPICKMFSTRRGGGGRRSSTGSSRAAPGYSSPATDSPREGPVRSSSALPETPPIVLLRDRADEETSAHISEDEDREVIASEAASSVVSCRKIALERDTKTGEIVIHPQISRVCTRSFKRVPNPTGFNWKDTPNRVKAQYYTFFKKFFTWPVEWEQEVYDLWDSHAWARFSNFLSDAKKKRDQGRPKHIPTDWWEGLCAYSDTPEVRDVSTRARGNRMAEVDGPGTGISKHSGGSKSVSVLARELATKNNLPLEQCVYASFRAIHMKKDGTFTTQKDADIDARVKQLAAEQGEGADLNMIYKTVLQEKEAAKEYVKKNRMYGTGSLAPSIISTGSSGGGSTTSQFHASEEIHTRFTSLEEQLIEERRLREEQAKVIEEERVKRQRLEEHLQAIQEMLTQQNLPPPSRSSTSP